MRAKERRKSQVTMPDSEGDFSHNLEYTASNFSQKVAERESDYPALAPPN
jgi:hypothetical protein